jgi:two-component system chemotaxis response regulator CheB
MIKILIVEDSPVAREFLIHILSSDPAIQVVATARDGEEALEVVKRHKPDVITMDIHMPKMNGFDAARRIMETQRTPIIIVSGSWDDQEISTTFRAMEAGAQAVIPRPRGIGHPQYEAMAKELIQTVKLMSEVKVVRRWPRLDGKVTAPSIPAVDVKKAPAEIQVVAIGASTGGPMALQTILSRLPKDFSVPVLIIQHMAKGFIQGFVEWLAQSSGIPVRVAAEGESLLPGHAYVAPDDFQMKVVVGHRIALSKSEVENGLCPSVSDLFRSVANVYGRHAIGVLLTGMGKDGAKELRLMKDKEAITIVQDEYSSVVYGMPGEAIKLDAATYVLSPDKIAAVLIRLASKV